MLFTTAFISTLFFSGVTYAQQGGNGNPQTPENGQTPQGMVNVHVVQVSNAEGSKKFYPESIQANAGEMVQFQFHPKNHSVVQADFSAPCTPISDVNPDVVGVKSGFMPVAAGANEMPVWTMMINSTDPMWLYCGAEVHCQGGMVMAINAAADGEKTLASYKTAAANAVSGAGAPAPDDAATGTDSSTGTDDNAGTDAASNDADSTNADSTNADSTNADSTNADSTNADSTEADTSSGTGDAAAAGSPTSSGPPISTGGASSMQTMGGAGLAGLFIACAAFIGL